MFLMYIVKVVEDGPPGQKVSAQRTDNDRESGRIVGSVPLQTTLSVASGHVRGLHLAQVCPLVVLLCLDIYIAYLLVMCSKILVFLIYIHASNVIVYMPLSYCNRTSIYHTHGWYLECYNHGSITYHKPACAVLPSCMGWFTCDFTTLPELVNRKVLIKCQFVAFLKQSLLTPVVL